MKYQGMLSTAKEETKENTEPKAKYKGKLKGKDKETTVIKKRNKKNTVKAPKADVDKKSKRATVSKEGVPATTKEKLNDKDKGKDKGPTPEELEYYIGMFG